MIDRCNAGFARISEVKTGDRISCARHPNTSPVATAPAYPTSIGRKGMSNRKLTVPFVRDAEVRSTLSTTSTKVWASSPRRRLTASISLLSERRAVTWKIHSSAGGGLLIKCFHAGISLVKATTVNVSKSSKVETYKLYRTSNEVGRR